MVEFLNIIEQILKKIIEETLKINGNKSDCQKFYYHILYVNIRLLEGAIFLLSQFKERPLFQVPFVSIMRDLISNLILAEYISHKENDPSANIEEELEKVFSEHYRFQKQTMKIEKALFGTYKDHTQYEEEFDKIGIKYMDDDGKLKPHLRNIDSTYKRIRYIDSKQKRDDEYHVRQLYHWYAEFSKIAHFGELTVHQVVNRYNFKNEKEVFDNYGHLLKIVVLHIVGLFVKVCYEEPVEESIRKDLERIINFEISP